MPARATILPAKGQSKKQRKPKAPKSQPQTPSARMAAVRAREDREEKRGKFSLELFGVVAEWMEHLQARQWCICKQLAEALRVLGVANSNGELPTLFRSALDAGSTCAEKLASANVFAQHLACFFGAGAKTTE